MPRAGSDRVFNEAWQRRVFGLTFATLAQGLYNTDENRFARESMDAADYRASSYWELWFAALETNLVDKQIVSFNEIDSRAATLVDELASDPFDVPRPELFAETERAIRGGVSSARDPGDAPRYTAGDRVRARTQNPVGHTRLPAYRWVGRARSPGCAACTSTRIRTPIFRVSAPTTCTRSASKLGSSGVIAPSPTP